MATYSDEVYDVYSIYLSRGQQENPDAKDTEKVLKNIDSFLRTGSMIDIMPDLLELLVTYKNNRDDAIRVYGGEDKSFLGQISSRISAFFRTGFASMWTGFWKNVQVWTDNTFGHIFDDFKPKTSADVQRELQPFIDLGILDKGGVDFITSLFKNNTDKVGFTNIAVTIGIIFTVIFSGVPIMMGDFIKTLKSKFTPEQLSPADLIQALHVAPEKTETINKKLAENGLDQADVELAKIASYRMLDVGTVMTCFLRKVISKDEAINRLEELGYTPKRIQEIMATWDIIPSPQDLLWMVGKEAFEADQQEKYGLNKEFPTAQAEWLEKQGLSKLWQDKYWIAHWDFPSEGRVLDLLHRGLINPEDMDAYYRLIEIPDYWRERLVKASYSPYTRVDLRRMHDEGLLTEDQVYENFREEGYDDEHAKNMVKFYIKYNDLNDKDLSLANIKKLYEADMITKAQAIEQLKGLQYSESQAELLLKIAEYDELVKIQKLRIGSISKMYKHGAYDKNKTRSLLSGLGVETKWIDVYLTQWDEEIIQNEKLPDKVDLLAWFSSGVIDIQLFTEYLRKYGYSDKTIAIYIKTNSPSKG